MSSKKSLLMFAELYQAGIRILNDSLLAENPRLTADQLRIERRKLAQAVGHL
ncbi:MAG: hypothetical protein ABIE84_04785 [bacterium]